MAKKKWIVLPGGKIKRWKRSGNISKFITNVPPHWYRNYLNRRERRKSKSALMKGREHRYPHIHPRIASWYW